MRLIDADKLYETLCHKWDVLDDEDFEKAVFEVIENAQPIDRWIPVSERLPEKREDGKPIHVLVTLREGFLHDRVYEAFFNRSDRTWEIGDTYEWDCDSILAWMPLPEPYKVGDKK